MTEPIFLQGVCKDYLWGGNRLREEFGKISGADKIAESWELACHKAVDVFTHTDCGKQSGAVVIGCDTVVDLDGEVLGKPKTADEAAEMLRSLSGRTHLVHTGYAVVSQGFVDVGVETTQVTFRKLTDEDVAVYVASGAPMDKAGAYGIQETDFVSDVVGSYDNVIGFPTEQINRLLIACGAVLQK